MREVGGSSSVPDFVFLSFTLEHIIIYRRPIKLANSLMQGHTAGGGLTFALRQLTTKASVSDMYTINPRAINSVPL